MESDLKKRSDHRVKIIAGQVKSLAKMIDEDRYCVDILTQSLAIQKSLSSLSSLVLENHIRTHVRENLLSTNGKVREKTIKELSQLYQLNNRGRN